MQNFDYLHAFFSQSPIRLFLLLTTPMVDPEDGQKEEWNKLLSALHCITGPLFVVYATGCKQITLNYFHYT